MITTSLGSDVVSVIFDGDTSPTDFTVGAPSWGVCVGDAVAYFTMPDETHLATFDFGDSSVTSTYGTVPIGCTEIIADQAGETLYVANTGATRSGLFDDQWQNSVFKIEISGGTPSVVDTLFTERQPRALALSPDESVLFVGTVQGALGQSGISGTSYGEKDTGNGFYSAYDGGSIVMYDTSTGDPTCRIPVGSPVRGLAVLSGEEFGEDEDAYRIYFTHVGFGVQSEDPDHGGKVIPNVLSSVLVDSLHEPQSRQDVVFQHRPAVDLGAITTNASLPAVLPEKVVVAVPSSKGGYAGELWVTNSASGTVSRAWIDPDDGSIAVGTGSVSLTVPVVDEIDRDGTPVTFAYKPGTTHVTYDVIEPAAHIRTDRETATVDRFRSRPRGIEFDPGDSTVVVATEMFADVVWFDAKDSTFSGMIPPAASVVSVGDRGSLWQDSDTGEGNFFTFGEGFDFREVGTSPADSVDNISCGTCHVDGHIDGKVRLTVRIGDNLPALTAERRAVVAVPSVRDAEYTEWIFFEGQRTVVDSIPNCGYCESNKFFEDTPDFVRSTPASPHEESTGLSADALRGRAWFDDMNCSRCHSGRRIQFGRTTDSNFPHGDELGPLNFGDGMLSDPSQSFVSVNGSLVAGHLSLRNLTHVGTRRSNDSLGFLDPMGNTFTGGVNTPALAGVWDARPYLHDGRYRTLHEVMENTWIRASLGDRAARVWGVSGPPDNLLDLESYPLGTPAEDLVKHDTAAENVILDAGNPRGGTDAVIKKFQTHQHGDADGTGTEWLSVKDHLDDMGETAYSDLVVFLQHLSSQLDPYPTGNPSIDSLRVIVVDWESSKVKWATPQETISRYEITNDETSTTFSGSVGPGTSHVVTVDTSDAPGAVWSVTVATSFNGLWTEQTTTWSAAPMLTNESPSTGHLTVVQGTAPYAVLAPDYNEDGYEDLFLSYTDRAAQIFKNSGSESEIASFTDRSGDDLGGSTLRNSQGTTAADINGDGHLDLFVAADDSNRLFLGDGQDFGDDQSTLLGDAKDMAASGGAFGDYNGDHWLDLFVMARSSGTGNVLLENCEADSLVDVTAAAGLDTTVTGSTSAIWADLNRDDLQDLIVGWGGEVGASAGQWTSLYMSGGADANGQFTFDDVAGETTGPRIPKFGHVNAIELADVNSDSLLDIVCVGDSTSASNNIDVWFNDGSAVFTAAPGSFGLSSSTEFVDLEMADLTGDGIVDLIAVPADSVAVEVFVGFGDGDDREYVDATDELDLGTARAYGVVAADFNRDTDPDLFLLRPESGSSGTTTDEQFFWANGAVDQTDPPDQARFFTVELALADTTYANPNPLEIGAIVTSAVERSDGALLLTTQVVDGGSGHGSQGARRLIFGLADAGTADVTVRWPDGLLQTFEDVDELADFPHITLSNSSNPGLINSSITASYTSGTSGVEWVFEWKTKRRCDAVEVLVDAGDRALPACEEPLGESQLKWVKSGGTGVTWTQTPDGEDWQQEMVWAPPDCTPNCSYSYTVGSVVGGVSYSAENSKTLAIGICPVVYP